MGSKAKKISTFAVQRGILPYTLLGILPRNGSDSLKETIEANYRQVKQEVLSLVGSETARIKADPTLSHLIRE